MEHMQMPQREMTQAGQAARQFFNDLVAAKEEYNDACNEYSRANSRRVKAHDRLVELTKEANDGLQHMLDDPTIPTKMPDCIETSAFQGQMNGQAPAPLRKW